MTLLYVGPVSLSCDMPHRAAVRGRQREIDRMIAVQIHVCLWILLN
jgi:hypothetical protein